MQAGSPEMPPAAIQVLNQRKYPASQLFLLMTLGPPIALLPFAETARGPLARVLSISAACRCSTTCCTSRSFTRSRSLSGSCVTALRIRSASPPRPMYPYRRMTLGLPPLYAVWLVAVAI